MTQLEDQYRNSTGRSGFDYCVLDPTKPQWQDWRDSPCCIIPFDLGSENVSGIHSLQYKFKVAAEAAPDFSHGICCDVDGVLSALNLKPVCIVGLISKNLYFGPNDEGWRFEQLRAHLRSYLDKHTPKTAMLFQSIVKDLVASFRRRGHDLGSDAESEEAAYKLLVTRAAAGRQGRKTSLARYLDGRH